MQRRTPADDRRGAEAVCDARHQNVPLLYRFGAEYCRECDFIYTPTLRADVQAHDAHHATHADLARRTRSLCTLPAGVWRALRTKYEPVVDHMVERIYRISFDSLPVHVDAVQAHVQQLVEGVMCAELGGARGFERVRPKQQVGEA